MYERILVPLDSSEVAEIALPYAEELAGSLSSEVTLVHVCESAESEHYHAHEIYIQKMVEATRHAAKRKAFKVKSAHLVGHQAEQIVDYADKEDIGLIVMATHGRSGVRRWVLGGVADKVVRATKRPVALIRAEVARPDVSEKGILKRAVVPLDGSKESEAVIPYIEELVSKLEGEIVLLHAVSPAYFAYSIPGEALQMPYSQEDMERFRARAEDYLETMVTALKDKGIKARSEVVFGPVAEEIIKHASAIDADVVAMSTHRRSGIGRWTFGSTADKVVQGGNTPVLLVKS